MDELIKLLDEYDTPLEHLIVDWEVKRRVKWTNLSTGEKYDPAPVWRENKSFWFIKRLVDNDKIDILKLDNRIALSEFNKVERVLMALSIQDNPIEFLVSVLK